jgi:hypothetical protein
MQMLTLLWFELEAAKRQLDETLADGQEPGKENLVQPEQAARSDQHWIKQLQSTRRETSG